MAFMAGSHLLSIRPRTTDNWTGGGSSDPRGDVHGFQPPPRNSRPDAACPSRLEASARAASSIAAANLRAGSQSNHARHDVSGEDCKLLAHSGAPTCDG